MMNMCVAGPCSDSDVHLDVLQQQQQHYVVVFGCRAHIFIIVVIAPIGYLLACAKVFNFNFARAEHRARALSTVNTARSA